MAVTLKTTSNVELECEVAVALANVSEGAARSTVLEATQVAPSHGFVTGQAVFEPKSSNDLGYSAATHSCNI